MALLFICGLKSTKLRNSKELFISNLGLVVTLFHNSPVLFKITGLMKSLLCFCCRLRWVLLISSVFLLLFPGIYRIYVALAIMTRQEALTLNLHVRELSLKPWAGYFCILILEKTQHEIKEAKIVGESWNLKCLVIEL